MYFSLYNYYLCCNLCEYSFARIWSVNVQTLSAFKVIPALCYGSRAAPFLASLKVACQKKHWLVRMPLSMWIPLRFISYIINNKTFIFQVRRKATENIFQPAGDIVENAMDRLVPEDAHCLPKPDNLTRAANRAREALRPEEPHDLNFEVRKIWK